MKVNIIFEEHDAIPPRVFDGVKRAIVAAMENWGLPYIAVSVNRINEMEAYQKWFDWNEERLKREELSAQVAEEAKGG